jgi:hypothetical protein
MNELFTRYRVSIRIAHRIMGGTPKDPKVIEGWIKSKIGLEDADELRAVVARTMAELGHDISEGATPEQLDAAIAATVADKSTNGFKRDDQGLYIESRTVKAMLKENVNILYGAQKFGPTRKGAKGYVAERIFVEEDRLHLGRTEPDGVELFIGHVTGPQGPRATLTYYEYCERSELSFTLMSLQDCITPAQWEQIFEQAEQNGLGSLRSQGYGRFHLLSVEPVAAPKRQKFFGNLRDVSASAAD